MKTKRFLSQAAALGLAIAFTLSCSSGGDGNGDDDDLGGGNTSQGSVYTYSIEAITGFSFTMVDERYDCREDGTLGKEYDRKTVNYSISGNTLSFWGVDFSGNSASLIGAWTREPFSASCNQDDYYCEDNNGMSKAVFTPNSFSYTYCRGKPGTVSESRRNSVVTTIKTVDCGTREYTYTKGNQTVKRMRYYSSPQKQVYTYNGKTCTRTEYSESQRRAACTEAYRKAKTEGYDGNGHLVEDYYYDILGRDFDKCIESNFPEWFYSDNGGTTEIKCGEVWYPDDGNTRCQNNVIETRCGWSGDWYVASANLRCQNDVLETKCGNDWYEASNANLRCQSNIIENKCGSSWYDASAAKFCSGGTLKNYGSVAYDGTTYKTTEIGEQVWMAENLNYNAPGSKCYDDEPANCAKYGRLYDWASAMGLPDCSYGTSCASQIGANHRGICPSGWHLPSDKEWEALTDFVGGSSRRIAGTKLKAISGWDGNGTNDYGFSALPGGGGYSDGSFDYVGNDGYWLSATEDGADYAYFWGIFYDYEGAGLGVGWGYYEKDGLLSVRCLQDQD
jgi:uncharacterized protein (TIGR02145 family)